MKHISLPVVVVLHVLLLLCCAQVAIALDLPRMVSVPHDTLFLSDNTPVFGTIHDIDETTGVISFQHIGEHIRTPYRRGQWLRYEHRRLQDETIRQRAEILLAAPPAYESDLLLTLNWALEEIKKEHENEERERAAAILDAAQQLVRDAALGGYAGNERVARMAITLLNYVPEGDPEGLAEGHADLSKDLETIVRAVFTKVPGFEHGFVALAEILEAQGREQELTELARQWVGQSRSSIPGNRLLARLVDRRGDLAEARDAYSRLYLHPRAPDLESGVAYARCNFLLGSHTRAAEIASEVMTAGIDHPDARIIVASDLLRSRDEARLPRVLELLESDQIAAADARLQVVGRYNLGVAQWRLGDAAAAAHSWRQLDDQAAALGLAMVERRVLRTLRAMPTALMSAAREVNAVLLLEQGDIEGARALLDDERSSRQDFLRRVAAVIDSNGSQVAVEALEAFQTEEARRWQVYGHIRGGRLDAARAVVAHLPADDGYAAVCRVFLAAVDHDEEEARRLYHLALRSQSPPAAYLEQIAREYEQEHDTIQVVDFSDWVEGSVLREGWHAYTRGTGIDVRLDGQAMLLGGEQRLVDPPETRVWTTAPIAALRHVQATCDLSGISIAHAGIEIRSDSGEQAVALAVAPDGSLVWRERGQDDWREWQSLGVSTGVRVTLDLELAEAGSRVWTRLNNRRVALGGLRSWGSERVQVGVFGFADAGTNWQLRVHDITLQRRVEDASQDRTRRRR